MANGRTHARYAGNFLFLASAGALGLTQIPGYREEAIALVLGAVGGWLVTPDIDITGRTYEERRIWTFSPLLGWLWMAYWYPYAKLIPHRHKLSHMAGIATALRMVYLLWWVPLFLDIPPDLFLWAWCTWTAQDVLHWVLDIW